MGLSTPPPPLHSAEDSDGCVAASVSAPRTSALRQTHGVEPGRSLRRPAMVGGSGGASGSVGGGVTAPFEGVESGAGWLEVGSPVNLTPTHHQNALQNSLYKCSELLFYPHHPLPPPSMVVSNNPSPFHSKHFLMKQRLFSNTNGSVANELHLLFQR